MVPRRCGCINGRWLFRVIESAGKGNPGALCEPEEGSIEARKGIGAGSPAHPLLASAARAGSGPSSLRDYRKLALLPSSWSYRDFDILAERREEAQQALHREGSGLPAHQRRYMGLLNAQDLAGRRLGEAAVLDQPVDSQGELGFELLPFRVAEAQVAKDVAGSTRSPFEVSRRPSSTSFVLPRGPDPPDRPWLKLHTSIRILVYEMSGLGHDIVKSPYGACCGRTRACFGRGG